MGSEKKNSRKISVWNWMGTLILCAIPGVNLIAAILFLIFGKAQAKRSFALALLLLMLIFAVLTCAAFIIFPTEIAQYAALLRNEPQILNFN